MTRSANDYSELQELDAHEWVAYLDSRSGLPGPRANLTLVAAAAQLASAEAIDALIADGGEYPMLCAAAALGRQATNADTQTRASVMATDDRWRVREGVAIGLQLLGDTHPTELAEIVLKWATDPNPLIVRAALAAICEPRLLHTTRCAEAALEACQLATTNLQAVPVIRRRDKDVRTLRQALGYCWSVAIAALPERGLPLFESLDVTDPDVAWVVAENRKKKRLVRLLARTPF